MVPVLDALLDAGHEVVGVYTRPDRSAGRGKRLAVPAVKRAGVDRGLPVFQPLSLKRDRESCMKLASTSLDAIVVAGYGMLLPAGILTSPRLGCLNVHPSLLPHYRGPSPVSWATLNGDAITGVTIMKLDEGMDTGPILAQREMAIGSDENAEDLTTRLFNIGSKLLVEILPRLDRGEIQAQPQDDSQASVTRRLSKEDGHIDWGRPASYIARQVRAYHPWPRAFTHWQSKLLWIVEASATESWTESQVSPGHVILLPEGVGIATGEGTLMLSKVQLEGRRTVGAQDFVRGHREFVGSNLDA